ncbi:MAG: type II toxin-antitoxin system VapC family toxin [Gaiellaceae bacterium]
MIAYFDASAFLKLVIAEPGTTQAMETWQAAHRKLSSLLLYAEARAGIARAFRMKRIGARQLGIANVEVDAYCAEAVLLEITESLTRRAGDLAQQHGLRAYDAVHLASVDAVADEETLLVAADGALVRAARLHGIATAAL